MRVNAENRSRRGVACLVVVLAAVPCVVPGNVLAAPAKKADDPETVKARELIKKAGIHYKVGEYEPAIAAYKEAYKLRPVPALLFNVAQGYRLLGDYKQAKFFYEGCLRDAPDAPYAEEARQRLEEVTEKLALLPPVAPVPAAPAPETAKNTVTPEVPAAALPPASPVAPAGPSESRPEAEEPEGEALPVLPIALAAGAGVFAIASAILFASASAGWSDVTKVEQPRAQVDAAIAAADAQHAGSIGAAVLAVGAGVGAAVTFAF